MEDAAGIRVALFKIFGTSCILQFDIQALSSAFVMAKRPPPNILSDDAGDGSVLSKRAEKRRKRKGKSRATTADSTDVIDLTFDDASERSGAGSSSRVESGITTPRLDNGHAFVPLPRSLISGISRSTSPGLRSNGQPTIEVDGVVSVDIRNPVKGSYTNNLNRDSALQSGSSMALLPHQSTTVSQANPLLLPDNVTLDTSDSAPLPAEPMTGVHFLDDDNNVKGVSRYFDEPKPEAESSFLATADQSKICSNCKRPGHKSRACPHTICPVCGEVDEHERRDCPFSLVCFGCGQRGHRQNVRNIILNPALS